MKLKHLFTSLCLLSGSLHAATVFGVNFTTNTNDHVTSSTLGTSSWTSSFAATGNSASTSGTFTTTESGVSVTYSANNFYSGGAWGTPGAANQGISLFRNYLDDGGAGINITVSGLGAWLTANNATSYEVMLLLSTDTGNATFQNYTVNGVSGLAGTVRGNGAWDGTMIGTPTGGRTDGTRGDLTVSNLTGNLTISSLGNAPAAQRGTVAGFVIKAIPEPSSALLGALSGLLVLRRRRQA